MDPISLAITTALANLSQTVIHDAYGALKAALQDRFGVDSELNQAIDKLEAKPESKARQAMLEEAIQDSGAANDSELLTVANTLIAQLKDLPGGRVDIKQDIKIRGDRNIVTGHGDVSVNE